MQRRHLTLSLLSLSLGARAFAQTPPPAAVRVGVLLMHGKTGSPQNPVIQQLAQRMGAAGWTVVTPEMPWSRNRYLQGDWDGVMAEMTAHAKALRHQGVTLSLIHI